MRFDNKQIALLYGIILPKVGFFQALEKPYLEHWVFILCLID